MPLSSNSGSAFTRHFRAWSMADFAFLSSVFASWILAFSSIHPLCETVILSSVTTSGLSFYDCIKFGETLNYYQPLVFSVAEIETRNGFYPHCPSYTNGTLPRTCRAIASVGFIAAFQRVSPFVVRCGVRWIRTNVFAVDHSAQTQPHPYHCFSYGLN